MRTVIQRVSRSSVSIDGTECAAIGMGMLVLVGFEHADTVADVDWMVRKVLALRIFDDSAGVMNRSIVDVGGAALIVSQFTLMASTSHGNRPSYVRAAGPDIAVPLYEHFVDSMRRGLDGRIGTGRFGADMQVSLVNDGPVTILIDSKNR